MNKKIGFIGAGNMGGAIIGGIVTTKILNGGDIFVYDKNISACEKMSEEYGTKTCPNIEDLACCDIIFLCVKPNIIYSVIENIKNIIKKDAVIVSIAAGQSIEKLEKAFSNDSIKLVRVMPNTPALVGEGMSAVSLNTEMKKKENEEEVSSLVAILNSLGKTEIVDEKLMDAVTGISGSAPAYVFMFIEAMADAAVIGGMPRQQAYTFASQAVLGSAKMVMESGKHPGELKDMVCSPSGTTIEAVKVLEEKGFRSAIIDAIGACIEKSKSM